jgi:hypothetical protein
VALRQRQVHRELADHGFACTGRRAHQNSVPFLQRLARGALERVELKAQAAGELVEAG